MKKNYKGKLDIHQKKSGNRYMWLKQADNGLSEPQKHPLSSSSLSSYYIKTDEISVLSSKVGVCIYCTVSLETLQELKECQKNECACQERKIPVSPHFLSFRVNGFLHSSVLETSLLYTLHFPIMYIYR